MAKCDVNVNGSSGRCAVIDQGLAAVVPALPVVVVVVVAAAAVVASVAVADPHHESLLLTSLLLLLLLLLLPYSKSSILNVKYSE